jgi:hypothetical protein
MISGKDETGKNITIVFNTIELLEWLDLSYMKEQAIKHIEEIGEDPNKNAEEEEERSECCGAEFQPDSDLCPDCKEHTGREI